MSIQPLSEDVIAQIKSSTTVTSLNGVIFELMKNSLDAGSTKVDITLDYGRGGCVVEDDGLGILPSEFREEGGLGKLYHSSKLNWQTSLHGSRGTFLASLSAMSLLSITSHHHLYRSHNTLSMHRSEVVSRQTPAPATQYLSCSDHGTRVTVRDLFGSMPVRVKQRTIVSEKRSLSSKEWESLKSSLVLLLLAWPSPPALNLREFTTNQRMVIRGPVKFGPNSELPRVCHILSQSTFIVPDVQDSWVRVGASTPSLKLSGMISLSPSPTKQVQFLSLDIQPLIAVEGQSILHDEINRLFLNSAFGNEEDSVEPDGAETSRRARDARYRGDMYTNKAFKGGKKGVDRWPMFYIRIQRANFMGVSNASDVDDILDNKANSLNATIKLLQAMIFEFLTRHHFRPKASPGQRSSVLEDDPDQEAIEGHLSLQQHQTKIMFEKSPSTKSSPRPRRVEKKRPDTIWSTVSELPSATVKLPHFRRLSSACESPFDEWSRVKSGAGKATLVKADELSAGYIIQRPSTAPPPSLSSVIKSTPPKPSIPLISTTGKILRRPFDDIPTPEVRSRSIPLQPLHLHLSSAHPASSQSTPTPIERTQDEAEDMIAWINPMTKVKSLINKRTGHAVPAINTMASQLSARSLFSPMLSSRPKLPSGHGGAKAAEPSPWLSNLLEKWDNPMYLPVEHSIPQMSLSGDTERLLHGHKHNCSQLDIADAFREASSSISGRISKAALSHAEVIGQVDRKFVLVKISGPGTERLASMLVIIDQHAADERIRVESLVAELCKPPLPRPDGMQNESGILTNYLDKGILYEVSDKDIELLLTQRRRFADWGILFDVPTTKPAKQIKASTLRTDLRSKPKFAVRALPPGVAERCKADPKLLIDLIRTELYSSTKPSDTLNNSPPASTVPSSSSSTDQPASKSWLTRIHTCPRGILDMLNSRACRSAIMFNDVLSQEQCEVLVKRLAETAFPFQCAHGRPSLLPLVDVGSVPSGEVVSGEGGRGGQGRFGKEFKRWKDETKKR